MPLQTLASLRGFLALINLGALFPRDPPTMGPNSLGRRGTHCCDIWMNGWALSLPKKEEDYSPLLMSFCPAKELINTHESHTWKLHLKHFSEILIKSSWRIWNFKNAAFKKYASVDPKQTVCHGKIWFYILMFNKDTKRQVTISKQVTLREQLVKATNT